MRVEGNALSEDRFNPLDSLVSAGRREGELCGGGLRLEDVDE